MSLAGCNPDHQFQLHVTTECALEPPAVAVMVPVRGCPAQVKLHITVFVFCVQSGSIETQASLVLHRTLVGAEPSR
jgi:hypothetical protein